MTRIRRIFAVAVVLVMTFAFALPAFAQTVGTAATGKGSITIENAAKGETYTLYKLFDAKNSTAQTSEGESVSIAYTGTIPTGLESYFELDSAGNIHVTDAAKDSQNKLTEGAVQALTTWAKNSGTEYTHAESDGSELVFAGLDYGYYVITSTQDDGKAISVDSTNPNATIIDKNKTTPVSELTKTVDDDDVFIGQTVTYTVSFKTANYDGEKQIVSYKITDTPATGSLTNIQITSVTVDGEAIANAPTAFTNNLVTIPWATGGTSLYENGATLAITYTATVASTAQVDGNGNTNTVTVQPVLDDGTEPDPSQYTDSETIYTYAIAIKKVDQSGQNLAGAKFQLPFYVNPTPADDGAYVYAKATAGDGLVNTIVTPDSGLIVIKGVQSGSYELTETEAPAGYNKLTAPVSVTATKTGQTTTSTTTYLDADGNIVDTQTEGGSVVLVTIDQLAATPIVVVNKTGAEMPSTGGIGTTIFYIVGGTLVVGALVFLLTKRRMADSE